MKQTQNYKFFFFLLEIFVAISTNLWTCEFFLSPLHGNRPVVLVAGGYAETTAEIFDYTQSNSWEKGQYSIT